VPLSADKPWFHAGGPRDHSSTTSHQPSSASSPGTPPFGAGELVQARESPSLASIAT